MLTQDTVRLCCVLRSIQSTDALVARSQRRKHPALASTSRCLAVCFWGRMLDDYG